MSSDYSNTEIKVDNKDLGNFGFLLDFNQQFLFELGQAAESYRYTNKRICAVFIRQLTEAFFDIVIEKFNINLVEKFGKRKNNFYNISEKKQAIYDYINKNEVFYLKEVFPDEQSGDGINYFKDPDDPQNDLFVWPFIERLGNTGSHPGIPDQQKKWLTDDNLRKAISQLCDRISIFFYNSSTQPTKIYKYTNDKACFRPMQTLFTVDNYKPKTQLYKEKLCFSVVPIPDEEDKTDYHKNKYALVRSFELKESNKDQQNFLAQSQRAYLKIQEHGGISGIPEFSVLADLKAGQEYYVVSYIFDGVPKELNKDNLSKSHIYKDIKSLKKFCYQFLLIIQNLTDLHIYHRRLTHKSIKLIIRNIKDQVSNKKVVDFDVKVVDLETCKLFGKSRTISNYIKKENINFNEPSLKQYNICREYDAKKQIINSRKELEPVHPQDEDSYKKLVKCRAASILLNVLCPKHIDNDFDGRMPADIDEIKDDKNDLWKDEIKNEKKEVFELAEYFELLCSDDFSIQDLISYLKPEGKK